jgi:hypothetical protein
MTGLTCQSLLAPLFRFNIHGLCWQRRGGLFRELVDVPHAHDTLFNAMALTESPHRSLWARWSRKGGLAGRVAGER